jgi:hypothetical protein
VACIGNKKKEGKAEEKSHLEEQVSDGKITLR